jgi:predicted DCC family thiol-disulfide oxidoreductase YuxK
MPDSSFPEPPGVILFFDGVCHLCHGSVNFLLERHVDKKVQFAPLQSDIARTLLETHGYHPEELNSILLLDEHQVYEADEAVLQVCKYLPKPWKFGSWLKIVPRWIRRPVYFWIAKRRYRWFGKYETCRLPQPGVKDRFLE